ncbi:AAA family ATPase [Micromonospora sp. NBC_01813]|uniref:AAA family ATPase n=1 Tax=Micromonospora sp. NBC_01813 TaxID=2975988 RepID=UPI002DDBB10D|nr:hypothetical protein [Micromonospora sp. NBC_01813]WSA10509.1 hypothetical protein OG958_06895 [Micromonospora sp. NBC_01813]
MVSGRLRQGKTYLLEALTRQTGGLYFGATQATSAESLRLFTHALTTWLGVTAPVRFDSWDEAATYLCTLRDRPGPIVLDEFPYLSKVEPALPSILQREIDRAVSTERPLSLLLCGSAMSVMGGLLAGSAPLRGRASLELVVQPFDHVLTAQFWGLTDPKLAVLHHAVVGGTPAYRRFVGEDAPRDLGDFDDWLIRAVLSPALRCFGRRGTATCSSGNRTCSGPAGRSTGSRNR